MEVNKSFKDASEVDAAWKNADPGCVFNCEYTELGKAHKVHANSHSTRLRAEIDYHQSSFSVFDLQSGKFLKNGSIKPSGDDASMRLAIIGSEGAIVRVFEWSGFTSVYPPGQTFKKQVVVAGAGTNACNGAYMKDTSQSDEVWVKTDKSGFAIQWHDTFPDHNGSYVLCYGGAVNSASTTKLYYSKSATLGSKGDPLSMWSCVPRSFGDSSASYYGMHPSPKVSQNVVDDGGSSVTDFGKNIGYGQLFATHVTDRSQGSDTSKWSKLHEGHVFLNADTRQLALQSKANAHKDQEVLWNAGIPPDQRLLLHEVGIPFSTECLDSAMSCEELRIALDGMAPEEQARTVICGGFPQVESKNVESLFKKCVPELEQVRFVVNSAGDTSLGVGYFIFKDEEYAAAFVSCYNGYAWDAKHTLQFSVYNPSPQTATWFVDNAQILDASSASMPTGYSLVFPTASACEQFISAHARSYGDILLVIRVNGIVLSETFSKTDSVNDVLARITDRTGARTDSQILFHNIDIMHGQLIRLNPSEQLSSISALVQRRVGHIVCVLTEIGLADAENHSTHAVVDTDGDQLDGMAPLSAETSAKFLHMMANLFDDFRVGVGCWSSCWETLRKLVDFKTLLSAPGFAEQFSVLLQRSLTEADPADVLASAVSSDILVCTERVLVLSELSGLKTLCNCITAAVVSTLRIQKLGSGAARLSQTLLELLCRVRIARKNDDFLLLEPRVAVNMVRFVASSLVSDPDGSDNRLSTCMRLCTIALQFSGDTFGPMFIDYIANESPQGNSIARMIFEWLAKTTKSDSKKGLEVLLKSLSAPSVDQSKLPSELRDHIICFLYLAAVHSTKTDDHKGTMQTLVTILVGVLFRGEKNAALGESSILLLAESLSAASPFIADAIATTIVNRKFGTVRPSTIQANTANGGLSGWAKARGLMKQRSIGTQHVAGAASLNICKSAVVSVNSKKLIGEDGVKLMKLLSESFERSQQPLKKVNPLKVAPGSRGVWSTVVEFEEDVILDKVTIGYTFASKNPNPTFVELFAGMSASRLTSVGLFSLTIIAGGAYIFTLPSIGAVRFASIRLNGDADSSFTFNDITFEKTTIKSESSVRVFNKLPMLSLAAVLKCTPAATGAIIDQCNVPNLIDELLIHICNGVSVSSAEKICVAVLAREPTLKDSIMSFLLSPGPNGILSSARSAHFCSKICIEVPECIIILWEFVSDAITRFAAGDDVCMADKLATVIVMTVNTVVYLERSGELPRTCFADGNISLEPAVSALLQVSSGSSNDSSRKLDSDNAELSSASKQMICMLMDLASKTQEIAARMLLAKSDSTMDHHDPELLSLWHVVSNLVDGRPQFALKMMDLFGNVASFIVRTVRDGFEQLTETTALALEKGFALLAAACRAGVGKDIVAEGLLEEIVSCFTNGQIKTADVDDDDGNPQFTAQLRTTADACLDFVHAAWNQSPDNRECVMSTVHKIASDASQLGYFLSQLVIKSQEFSDVVYVIVDDSHALAMREQLATPRAEEQLATDALFEDASNGGATLKDESATDLHVADHDAAAAKLPTYAPTVSYSCSNATYTVSPHASIAEIMLLHGNCLDSEWYVHDDGEERRRLDDMLVTVESLSEGSIGDCIRLSVSPRSPASESVVLSASDSPRTLRWVGQWKSGAVVSTSWLYEVDLSITVQGVGADASANGQAVIAFESMPKLDASKKYTGPKRHTFGISGTFVEDSFKLRLKANEKDNGVPPGSNVCFSLVVSACGTVVCGTLTGMPLDSGLMSSANSGQMLIASTGPGVVHFVDPQVRSPLIDLGMLGGLGHFMSLVKEQISDASKSLELQREAAPESERKHLEKSAVIRRQLFAWLSAMEGSMGLPGFVERFIADKTSAALLQYALGAGDLEVIAKTPEIQTVLQDPTGSQLTANLTNLFSDSSTPVADVVDLRAQCIEQGTLDIVLLHLGKLHETSPADHSWTDQFEDPAVVRERKAKELAHAEAEKLKAAAAAAKEKKSASKAGGGSTSEDAFVIPAQGFQDDGNSGSMSMSKAKSPSSSDNDGVSERPSKEIVHASTKGTFNCLTAFLTMSDDVASQINAAHLRRTLEASPLVKVLQSVMMATETDDIQEHPDRYGAVVGLLAAMTKHEFLIGLVDVGAGPTSPYQQLLKHKHKVDTLVKTEDGEGGSSGNDKLRKKETKKQLVQIQGHIATTIEAVKAWLLTAPVERAQSAGEGGGSSGDDLYALYADMIAKHHFAYRSLVKDTSHVYKYKSELGSSTDAKPERQKALLRELTGNLLELPIHFNTCTLLRVEESQWHAMQFLVLAGEEGGGSPYDGGAFLFDLFVPPTYPRSPPKVTLATTGGGTVRFNPNLYLDGYVCLTILNAKGAGAGTWRAGDSNIFEVIMAIQSFVLNKMYPLFNEPSEGTKFRGKDTDADSKRRARTAHWSGSQFGNTGYQAVREGTLEHAMIGQLRNPSSGFEDAIRTHFLLKGPYITRQVEGWIDDADRFDDTASHKKKLESLLVEFKAELAKLSAEGKYTDGSAVGPVPATAKDAAHKYQQYPW